MEFRTEIFPAPLPVRIDHSRRGVMLGSCFAENIAARMQRAKFPVARNPFGVLYNPLSIAQGIEMLSEGRQFAENDLRTDGELWYSFAHHGSFSAADPAHALAAMNESAKNGAAALRDADYIVLTLGTAWVYELADGGGVVANCHKQPASMFHRCRMSLEEVAATLATTIEKYLTGKDIILTVSPIRHLKDGLAENSRSKAILVEACHRITESYGRAAYFPAYEIMMDDLRDYRFYERDMTHPSAMAVDYIWEKFCAATMDEQTRKTAAEMESLASAVEHRPLHGDTPSYARFRETMLARARELQAKYPAIDLEDEINSFTR